MAFAIRGPPPPPPPLMAKFPDIFLPHFFSFAIESYTIITITIFLEPSLTNSITFTKAENVNDDVGTFLLGGVTDLAAKASYILATSSLSDQSQHCLTNC